MTSSGDYSFSQNREQICARALRQVGAIANGETPSAEMASDIVVALNAMVAEWQATGIHVWTEVEAILFTQPGQVQYGLGGTNTDNACEVDQWDQSLLSNDVAIGDLVITVDSTSEIAAGDYIGLVPNSGTVFWTTVASILTSTTLRMSSPATSAIDAGSFVFSYTTKLQRPLRIPRATRYIYAQGDGIPTETSMIVASRQEYMDMPNKLTRGTINQFFYAPLIGPNQRGPAALYLWPAPIDNSSGFRFTSNYPLQDFASAPNTANFPQEWTNALTWGVAEQVMLEYDVPPQRAQLISAMAAKSYATVSGWDKEPESVYFGVDFQQGG